MPNGPMPQEDRDKISYSVRNSEKYQEGMAKHHSDPIAKAEHYRKVSDALTGKSKTPEHRANLSKARRKRNENPLPNDCKRCGEIFIPHKTGVSICDECASERPAGQKLAAIKRRSWRCLICASTEKKLVADHDHVTGFFRGFVCGDCNIGMGMFFDNPEFMRAAIAYLETFQCVDLTSPARIVHPEFTRKQRRERRHKVSKMEGK